MKILVIDDEKVVLTLFKDILESVGHEVQIAIDGEIGIALVKEALENGDAFDLVVMDYRMHGMDGMEVSEEIWVMDDDTPIMFASADPTIKKEALHKGAVSFLHKSFNLDKLVDEVERIMRK